MTISYTVSEYGTKAALRLVDPNRIKSIRNKGVSAAADFMVAVFIDNSRDDTGKYWRKWRKVGRGQGERRVINDMPYAKYVTGASMWTTYSPQGEAGNAFVRKIAREYAKDVRAIILKIYRREYSR